MNAPPETCAEPPTVRVEEVYAVPPSQVWSGSRGGHEGSVHLRLLDDFESGRLRRRARDLLCNAKLWDLREPGIYDLQRCRECVERAKRHGIPWPPNPTLLPGRIACALHGALAVAGIHAPSEWAKETAAELAAGPLTEEQVKVTLQRRLAAAGVGESPAAAERLMPRVMYAITGRPRGRA